MKPLTLPQELRRYAELHWWIMGFSGNRLMEAAAKRIEELENENKTRLRDHIQH